MKQDHTGKLIKLGAYCLYGLFGAYLCCILCMWRNIKISVAILKTTAHILFRNIRLLMMPLITGAILVGWTLLWLYMFALMVSTGDITQPKMGSQAKSITFSSSQWQMLCIQVFMYLWVMEFIQAGFQFAILAGVCTWYFTSTQDSRGKFRLLDGFWWAFRYNFGSLALGSCLLAVIWTIRLVFEFINKQVNKMSKESAVAGCIVSCTRCCIDCFHRFVKFLNKNAYTQVVLTGNSFCMSAMQAFLIALKNSGTFFINNGIGGLINYLGKAFITIVNTGIGYLVITFVPRFKEDIDQPIPFLLLIMLMSYELANSFMNVYSGCSLAVLQCLYTDVDICKAQGKDPMDNSGRPRELNYVVGILAQKAKDDKAKAAEKEQTELIKK